jgi:hypothetical protein
MTTCPESGDTFLRLLDGQLSEERANALRAHAAGCQACAKQLANGEGLLQRLAAPASESSIELKAQLLRRVSQLPQTAAATAPMQAKWLPLGLAGALALALLVPAVSWLRRPETSAFTPRGAGPAAFVREVGARYYIGGTKLQRLESGARLTAAAPIVTTYRNVSRHPAYLLSVAVDAVGKVHWLQPEDGATEPLELRPNQGEDPLPEMVALDSPAPGPLRIVTLLSPTPVSPAVLAVPPSEATLAARFPEASISELTLTVVP